MKVFALALFLCPLAIAQSYVVQSQDLDCGGPPTFQELVMASPAPFLGVDVSATVPTGQFGFLFFDRAVQCYAFVPPPATNITDSAMAASTGACATRR